MKKPIVTVIVPTWNRSCTIKTCVLSVLNQTFSDLEVLVCDDGSTDNTEKIINSIKDKRIKWIAGEHSGSPVKPRNTGISYAQGEWIAFLDSDDKWLPQKLAIQLQKLKQLRFKACSTNAFRLDSKKKINGKLISAQKDFFNFGDILKSNSVICSSIVIHKSLFKAVIGFPDLKTGEDYGLWLRLATLVNIKYIDQPLLYYLDCPNNSLRAKEPNFASFKLAVLENWMGWYKNLAKKPSDSKTYYDQVKRVNKDLTIQLPRYLILKAMHNLRIIYENFTHS